MVRRTLDLFARTASPATKRRRDRRLRRNSTGEAGQTCPHCGDLWPWSLVRCLTCNTRLR